MSADILVVDDEADIRELVAGLLEDEGYRTRKAGSADEALAAIAARRPNLVFLDIWLQGSRLDGLQVLELVKESHPDLPVVMITSRIAEKHREHARELGVDHYLGKPYVDEELLDLVRRYSLSETPA